MSGSAFLAVASAGAAATALVAGATVCARSVEQRQAVSNAPARINRLIIFGLFMWGLRCCVLNGHFAFFFGADADGFFNVRDEYLAIADFPCFGGFRDDRHGAISLSVGEDEFDFDFG